MEREMTGYPSVDKPWLKYYKADAFDKALKTPKDKSLYRYYMENVFTDPDFPILKYFNRTFSTKQFTELIETWARAFCTVGVKEDEMVPVYGTWCPEIAAIIFALNAIGAYPYFEKLDITKEALLKETEGARIGVVFEPLWNETAKAVFDENRFEKVFILDLAESMCFPLKQLVNLKNRKRKKNNLKSEKYIYNNQISELAAAYTLPFEAPFKKDRIAVITTSSGTTSSMIKGIMDTNEGALANIISTAYSEPGFIAGKECLITLPPTASTGINCFFLLPLYMGMTVRIDPRADQGSWIKLIMEYKPSLSATTGSLWYSFYRQIADMREHGKNVDLSFMDTFILGGSGVTPEQLAYINTIAKECKVQSAMDCGYGCSEFFGVITVDKHQINNIPRQIPVIDVGIPIPGAVVGVFDEDGNELPYGERGELWAKGPSIMHGYFGKPDLSKEMFDGEWLKTGDICEIDENGYVYCYGRMKSSIKTNGRTVFLFDVANALRQRFNLEDCMVEVKNLIHDKQSVVVYFVQKHNLHLDSKSICEKMNTFAATMDIIVDGYREFDDAFPISPTTLKPMTRFTDGFINYSASGSLVSVSYLPTNRPDIWEMRLT